MFIAMTYRVDGDILCASFQSMDIGGSYEKK